MPVKVCPWVPVTLMVSLGSDGCVEPPLKMNHATAAASKMQTARIARPLFMIDSCRLPPPRERRLDLCSSYEKTAEHVFDPSSERLLGLSIACSPEKRQNRGDEEIDRQDEVGHNPSAS